MTGIGGFTSHGLIKQLDGPDCPVVISAAGITLDVLAVNRSIDRVALLTVDPEWKPIFPGTPVTRGGIDAVAVAEAHNHQVPVLVGRGYEVWDTRDVEVDPRYA